MVAAEMTGSNGRYSLQADDPGRYLIRVGAVGHEVVEGPPFDLTSGSKAFQSLLLGAPTRIAGSPAAGTAPCILRPSPRSPTGLAWSEALKALRMANWAVESQLFEYQLTLTLRGGLGRRPYNGIH